MVNYKNGKIYKMCYNDDMYIGSTCCSLKKRFREHKCRGLNYNKNRLCYKNIDNWDDVSIELIEDYPCDNKLDLLKRERYYIDLLKPNLNYLIPSRSKKEYQKEWSKEYRKKRFICQTH